MTYDPKILDLYMAHRASLIDYATPIVGCRGQAEDVVQEAYIRMTAASREGRAEKDRIAQPVGYLYRVVRNLAVDVSRRLSWERKREDRTDDLESMDAGTPSPETEALYRNELRLVSQALSELPERTQIVFEMYRLGDCTLQEISQKLGISVTLAHQLVRKAMAHCAERLGDREP